MSEQEQLEVWKTKTIHSLEVWKTQETHKLEVYKTELHREMMIYQNVNMHGQGALKAALFINGGASVALLAFLGTTLGKSEHTTLPNILSLCMLLFIIGTLFAAVAAGVSYIAVLIDSYDDGKIPKWRLWRKWWPFNLLAIFLVIFSYAMFAFASYRAYHAFITNICKI